MDAFRVDGKVAAVTGAARGIGRAVATGLATAGADVAILDLPAMEIEAAETVRAVQAAGRRATFVGVDISRVPDIAPAIDRVIAELGGLHILVNDAGVVSNKPALELDEAEWNRVFAVNLKGMFFCCVAAAQHMRAHGGGRIVNVTSGNGQHGNRSLSTAYIASKGGVISLTRSLALEWIGDGINVNCVGPGVTNTPMIRQTDVANARTDADIREQAQRMIPIGRRLEPEEIANAVIFLCTPAASATVGELIVVDGGMAIR
jgi:NAD(P)-dependent dehydrogenase (short-subunit alcohol dehydrogenase family)